MAPLARVIARGEDVAVGISRLGAYPQGFECDVFASARLELELDPFEFRRGLLLGGDASSAEPLAFGIEFSDGRKVTNADARRDPDAPVMIEQDGGGGTGEWTQSYWIAPLPPPGPMKFIAAWPAAGVPEGSTDVDAALLLDAAKRSQPIWDLPDAPEGFVERE